MRRNPDYGVLTLYHGTGKRMDRPSELLLKKGMDYGPGFYLATDMEDSRRYGSWVYEVRVRLANPIVISPVSVDRELVNKLKRVIGATDDDLAFYENPIAGIFELARTMIEMDLISPIKFRALLQKLGYDGIFVDRKYPKSKGDYVAIFSPDQILSWELTKWAGPWVQPNRRTSRRRRTSRARV